MKFLSNNGRGQLFLSVTLMFLNFFESGDLLIQVGDIYASLDFQAQTFGDLSGNAYQACQIASLEYSRKFLSGIRPTHKSGPSVLKLNLKS